jgi:hypothetical protein
MKNLARVLAAAALSLLCLTACSDSRSPGVQFLASDIHFMIGGQHIVIPAVAMRGADHSFDLSGRKPEKSLKETLKLEASDPSHPMKTDSLDLLIREYQYTGEHMDSEKICPLLTRKWSQTLCRGQHRGVLWRLPEKFDLLDRARLDRLNNHGTVGIERQYDQAKDMAMQLGVTEIGCDRESRFCTAMVEVLQGLLAVWTVWSDATSGALGPTEDPTLVDAD